MSHRAWRVCFALTSALAIAMALFIGGGLERAHAGPQISTLYVTSAEDGPANPTNCPSLSSCRLRDALAASNPGDFILFNLPGDSVIVLTEGELVVPHTLLIINAIVGNLTVSGNNASRVFNVSAPLVVVSLTIAYGNVDGSGGGLATDSPVTLHYVRFLGNAASNDGGGLYAGSTAELSSTTFISNTSVLGNGGGALIGGSASVKGGAFERNRALRPNAADYGSGGGLVTLGPLDLMGTQFLSNTSGNSGGGLATAFGSAATLANATFRANQAGAGGCCGFGGGLRAGGSLDLTHVQFLSNMAPVGEGGGLSVGGAATLTDTQFLSNTGRSGGGAFLQSGATLNGAQFRGNGCTYAGCITGGVFGYSYYSTLTLTQVVTTSDDLEVWANWVNNGTFVQSAGTTTFQTYFPLSVMGTGSTTFHHVRIEYAQGISISAAVNVTGDFTNAVSVKPAGGSVTFNGSGAQRIGGGGTTTFGDLAIANTGPGVLLGQNITVANRLTLTSDLTTTSGYTLFLSAGATSIGNGDVWGRIVRAHPFSLGTTYAFGNPFVSLNFTGGTPPSAVALELTHTPPLNVANTVRRGYAIAPAGGSGYVARLRLHYRDGELNGNAEGALKLWRYPPVGSWTSYSASGFDSTDNWVEHNNVTALSWWVLSEFAPLSRLYLPLITKTP